MKIACAFLAITLITLSLGLFASHSLGIAETLVVRTFDNALMSISYARASATDFANMQSVMVGLQRPGSEDAVVLRERMNGLSQTLADDLAVAAERSLSPKAAQAAQDLIAAAATWEAAALRLIAKQTSGLMASTPAWQELDTQARDIAERIDLLINYTAGDGFSYRQRAIAAVHTQAWLNMVGLIITLVLSITVSVLLQRQIMRPVMAASAAAVRIASGELDTEIPGAGSDELGALLTAMERMRGDIRSMVHREVSQRRSAEARLADALESSQEGLILVNRQGEIVVANSQMARFMNTARHLLEPSTSFDKFLQAVAVGQVFGGDPRRGLEVLSKPSVAEAGLTAEERLTDGRWLRVSRSTTSEGGFVTICSDITALKNREDELHEINLRFEAALGNMSQGLALFDAGGRLQVANPRLIEIFRLSAEQVRPGITHRQLLGMSIAAGNHPTQTAGELYAQLEARIERRKAGAHLQDLSNDRVIAISHEPTHDGGWVETYEDITERRKSEAQIVFMARHDALTGLPNRILFSERVEQSIAQSGRGRGFAVLCLDLDRFKIVNDTLGHPIGDRLLRAVAERIRSCIRETDTVARLGGDEFAIVQTNLARPEDAGELAQRVVLALSRPFDIEGNQIVIGTSVGIALGTGDKDRVDRLLKSADTALYCAKADGRGTFRFFEAQMEASLQARREMEVDLRRAIGQDEFVLNYQPLIDLKTNRISACEALVRWRHPSRGMVSPAEFIPLAEEISLIVQLGDWVLKQACKEAAAWPSDIIVAVNVSAVQFRNGRIFSAVQDALALSGLPSSRLELEITETVMLAESDSTISTLHSLRDLGVRIAMDDFGTGYSSLSYLRSFPFDKIKIDQEFIRDLTADNDSGAIIRAIIGLGTTLGMKITAEGVETQEQLACLRAEGCHEVQGYLFSRPLPAPEIKAMIARDRGEPVPAAAVAGQATSMVLA
jgi:diguanylate cyclase (GGDEF)-like protein